MYGLKALQADGLVQQRQEVKPAMVQMRNSVDTYYRFRSQPLLRAKPMVELAPKRMGSTYFNTFMAVPDSCAKLPIFKVKKMLLYKKFLLFIS